MGPIGQKPIEPDNKISFPKASFEKFKNWIDGVVNTIAEKIFKRISTDAQSQASSSGNLQGVKTTDVTAEKQRLDEFFRVNLETLPEVKAAPPMGKMAPADKIKIAFLLARDVPAVKEMLKTKHGDPVLQGIIDEFNKQIKDFEKNFDNAERGYLKDFAKVDDRAMEAAARRFNQVADNAPRGPYGEAP